MATPMVSNIPNFNKSDFGGITFELPNKYQAIKLIGKGTYGSVISAKNQETNEQVAIKKLSHIEDVVSVFTKTTINVSDLDRCQTNPERDYHNEEFRAREYPWSP